MNSIKVGKIPTGVFCLLVLLLQFVLAESQLSLRSSSLTSSQQDIDLGLFSKWKGLQFSHRSSNTSNSIENELAAIFRGVAYGMSTSTPTSEIPSSSRIPVVSPRTKLYQERQESIDYQDSPFSLPVPPNIQENFYEELENDNTEKPIQQHYLETPVDKYSITKTPTAPIELENATEDLVNIVEAQWLAALEIAWTAHVYCAAVLFTLVAFLSLYWLARIHATLHLLPKAYYVTIHLLIFLAAFFRSVFFFHDPYGTEKRLPPALSSILFNTGTPCVIAAQSLLMLALLRAARTHLLPLQLQTPIALAIISILHVGSSLSVDLISGIFIETQWAVALQASVQALSAGWGAALCLGYIAVFSKIDKAAMRQHSEIVRLAFTRVHMDGAVLPHRLSRSSLSTGARLSLAAAICGIFLSGLQVYGLMAQYGGLEIDKAYPWAWFGYHSFYRTLELVIWCCFSFASGLPANSTQINSRKGPAAISYMGSSVSSKCCCFSCSEMSGCNDSFKQQPVEGYPTLCQTNHVIKSFTLKPGGTLYYKDTLATQNSCNITTTVVPETRYHSLRKSATLNSATSDANLLCNYTHSSIPSSHSSRPSSMLLSDGAFIRVKTQNGKINDSCAHDSSLNNAGMDKLNKHNANEEQGIIQENIYAEEVNDFKECQGKSYGDRYADMYAQQHYYRDPLKRQREQSKIKRQRKELRQSAENVLSTENWIKYTSDCSSITAANSFDAHLYNEPDVIPCYESPLFNYDNGDNFLKESHLSEQNFKRLLSSDSRNLLCNRENTVEQLEALLAPRPDSLSPQSDVHVDYLTDASGDNYCIAQSPTPPFSDSDVYSSVSKRYDVFITKRAPNPVSQRNNARKSSSKHRRKQCYKDSSKLKVDSNSTEPKNNCNEFLESESFYPLLISSGSCNEYSKPFNNINLSNMPDRSDILQNSRLKDDVQCTNLTVGSDQNFCRKSKHSFGKKYSENSASKCHNNAFMLNNLPGTDERGSYEKNSVSSSRPNSSVASNLDLPSECVDSDDAGFSFNGSDNNHREAGV